MPIVAYDRTLPDRVELHDTRDAEISRVAGSVFARLGRGALAVLVKTSRLTLSPEERLPLACRIVAAFATRVGAAFDLDVATEVDRPQRCDLPAGATRTLLPHHDGGHCSFLTVPAIAGSAPRRSMANDTFTTTSEHKIYQGLLLRDAGEAMSLTSYFDLVQMIVDAWTREHGSSAAPTPTLSAVLAWYQANVTLAIERAGAAGYLPIGAQLGARGVSRDVAMHAYEAFHDIAGQRYRANDLADDLARTSLGLSFLELTQRYAVLAPAETGDLLIGHNLFAWHGGVEGGRGREILPICVTTQPFGPAYERWLALHWERFFANATAPGSRAT